MRVQSAFCDLHPDSNLAQGSAELGWKYSPPQQTTLCCKQPRCGRHFHYDFGYFTPEEASFGDLGVKPKCSEKHDQLFMLLTRIDGALVYACFHPDCTNTVPYP
jgi:hypothetical protein